eukprot:2347212-Heterocapsa_arctica.AAC.1
MRPSRERAAVVRGSPRCLGTVAGPDTPNLIVPTRGVIPRVLGSIVACSLGLLARQAALLA